MSIIDNKNFAGGGMDTDSAPELVAKNDYITAYNLRNTGNKEGEDGYVVAIESNELIDLDLPAGINKCIGAHQFEAQRLIYKFIFNSNNYHCITELNYDTNQETILFTNLLDSNGEDALVLNSENYVNDIKLIENLLIFRNSLNEPCLINIARLKSGGYGSMSKDDFLLIKQQPYITPNTQLTSDPNFSANFLRGKIFQFRYQFGYDDNETSVWSLMSDRPVPEKEQNPNIGTISTVNNAIVVGVNIGGEKVKNINISVRQGDYDWAIVKEVSREHVLSIYRGVIDILNGITECYDELTNTYYFTFYNNGLYQSIDVLETDLLYDYIPKQSDSLEVINGRGDVSANGSILVLGSNTEGYERPSVDVSLSISAADSGIEYIDYEIEDPLRFNKKYTYAVRLDDGNIFRSDQRRQCWIGIEGMPRINDKVILYVTELNGKTIAIAAEHIVTSDDIGVNNNESLYNIAKKLAETLTNSGVGIIGSAVNVYKAGDRISKPGMDIIVPQNNVIIKFTTVDFNSEPFYTTAKKPHVIQLASIGTGDIKSIPSLKTNSSYQIALAYYDKWGRPFPIMTNQQMSLQTDSYAEYKGYVPYISWSINSSPPADAYSYQWLSSKNTTHLNTVYVDGYYKSSGDKGSYIEINVNSLNKYQENNPNTTVVYDFSKGDRITFCYYLNEVVDELVPVWFDGIERSRVDLEILSYDIIVTEVDGVTETNYVLKVQKPSDINLIELQNKVILAEVYTPLNSSQQLDNTIFYEIGERYNIVDGEHSVTSGSISGIDCYFKTREYNIPDPYGSFNLNGNKTFLVEDFNFSDFYASNFSSLGRPRGYFDTPENVKYPSSIRYSYEFISKSKINLLNRFYGENLVTYDLKYGSIKKMQQRDNTLVCIQETKVGYVPVSISIIEDQASKQNVATSTLLLNKIRYSNSGTIGIGNAVESFSEYSGIIYFVDPNRSEPIQIGYDGVKVISGKMSKFFKKTLKEASEAGRKIIGYYNIYNNEYILTVEQESGVVLELSFNNSNWEYLESFTVNPSTLAITTAPTKGDVTVNTTTGIATYIADIGETGSDSFAFSFTPEEGVGLISKNVCINISEGDTDIPFFSLNEVTNQELSTFSDPSIQVGPFDITSPVSISISPAGPVTFGQYKINDGDWTSDDGYFYPGDYVVVRVSTSDTLDTSTSATLTIGTQSATFTATTGAFEESGYFIIDLMSNNPSDTIAGLLEADGVTAELVYTGSNEYPVVENPDNAYMVASDYHNFSPGNSGWRFVFNMQKLKLDYPDLTDVTYKVIGLKSGLSGYTAGAFYSSKTPSGTLISSGSPGTLMYSVTGGATVYPFTSNSAYINPGADGTYPDTMPNIAIITYNFTTGAISVSVAPTPV